MSDELSALVLRLAAQVRELEEKNAERDKKMQERDARMIEALETMTALQRNPPDPVQPSITDMLVDLPSEILLKRPHAGYPASKARAATRLKAYAKEYFPNDGSPDYGAAKRDSLEVDRVLNYISLTLEILCRLFYTSGEWQIQHLEVVEAYLQDLYLIRISTLV
jgi:hypothetical protein